MIKLKQKETIVKSKTGFFFDRIVGEKKSKSKELIRDETTPTLKPKEFVSSACCLLKNKNQFDKM